MAVYSDDFTGTPASGLGGRTATGANGGWTWTLTGGSDVFEIGAGGNALSSKAGSTSTPRFYEAPSVGSNDQYVQARAKSGTSGNRLMLRMDPTGRNGYGVRLTAGNPEVVRYDNNVPTTIGDFANNMTEADVLRLEIEGTTLRVYKNGVQIGTDITDATYASGSTGLMQRSSLVVADQYDDFETGSLGGGGGNTYTDPASGTLTGAGTAAPSAIRDRPASGTLAASGTALLARVRDRMAAGAALLGGLAEGGIAYTDPAAGALTTSGTAATERTRTGSALGALLAGGSALASRIRARVASGGAILSGTALASGVRSRTASGGMVLSGTAPAVKVGETHTTAASGSLTLSGYAGSGATSRPASGGFALLGLATYTAPPRYRAPTNAQLAVRISDLVSNWNAHIGEHRDWLAGSATGGPNSDGRFPLTDAGGTTTLVESPARLADLLLGPASTATTARDDAEAASLAASTVALQVTSDRDASQASRVAAEAARDLADSYKAQTANDRSYVQLAWEDFSPKYDDFLVKYVETLTARDEAVQAALDAAVFDPADYLPLVGGTMTGGIKMGAPPHSGYALASRLASQYGAIIETVQAVPASSAALWLRTSTTIDGTFSPLLRVQNNGLVGIGTDSPGARLHVASTVDEAARFESAGNPYISLYRGATRVSYIAQDGLDQLVIRNQTGGAILFVADGIRVPGGATSTLPASPGNGTLYYDTTTNKLRAFAGGTWVDLH